MSEEKKVEFVKKEPDPELQRISKETIKILRADGSEILRKFFD